jgi:hypothetical protein
MKNAIKSTFATLLTLSMVSVAFAQTKQSIDTFSVVGGKWVVCADTILISKYECSNPYSGFEFLKDGRYKEYPKTMTDPTKQFLQGSWTLSGNTFTIDQDDEPGTKELPKTYTIVWVDKNRFYTNNKVGDVGPQMFVYFQRLL